MLLGFVVASAGLLGGASLPTPCFVGGHVGAVAIVEPLTLSREPAVRSREVRRQSSPHPSVIDHVR
jgi:hypothetical protein